MIFQVNCVCNLCGLGNLADDKEHPYKPASPYQWWRLPLSLLYHHGVLDVFLVVAAQVVIGFPMEKVVGWFRMLMLYVISGLTALIVC